MKWIRGATNEDSCAYLSEEQRSRHSKINLPPSNTERAGLLWTATASLGTYITMLCRVSRSLFRYKLGQPDASPISSQLLKGQEYEDMACKYLKKKIGRAHV